MALRSSTASRRMPSASSPPSAATAQGGSSSVGSAPAKKRQRPLHNSTWRCTRSRTSTNPTATPWSSRSSATVSGSARRRRSSSGVRARPSCLRALRPLRSNTAFCAACVRSRASSSVQPYVAARTTSCGATRASASTTRARSRRPRDSYSESSPALPAISYSTTRHFARPAAGSPKSCVRSSPRPTAQQRPPVPSMRACSTSATSNAPRP
mmetsp:Transcript_10664/g.36879  ORF Transcript_10664/g.36879 Transcript_10664/m.36879 type:complete len:211 (-) Transcript_10664:761-1393(-)